MAQHTPGPWHFDLADGSHITAEGGTIIIADAWSIEFDEEFDNPDSVPAANARLIAAAPDLLDACEFFLKFADMRAKKGDELPSQLTGAVRAAIAKAKGGAA